MGEAWGHDGPVSLCEDWAWDYFMLHLRPKPRGFAQSPHKPLSDSCSARGQGGAATETPRKHAGAPAALEEMEAVTAGARGELASRGFRRL